MVKNQRKGIWPRQLARVKGGYESGGHLPRDRHAETYYTTVPEYRDLYQPSPVKALGLSPRRVNAPCGLSIGSHPSRAVQHGGSPACWRDLRASPCTPGSSSEPHVSKGMFLDIINMISSWSPTLLPVKAMSRLDGACLLTLKQKLHGYIVQKKPHPASAHHPSPGTSAWAAALYISLSVKCELKFKNVSNASDPQRSIL